MKKPEQQFGFFLLINQCNRFADYSSVISLTGLFQVIACPARKNHQLLKTTNIIST